VKALLLFLLLQQNPLDEAWRLLEAQRRPQAVALLRRLVETRPTDAEPRLMLGALLSEEGHREALVYLKDAVRLRPQSAEAHHAYGEALRAFNELAPARAEFARAVELKPTFAQARSDYGRALLEAGSQAEALPQLERAIALFGAQADAAEPLYLRGRIQLDQGHFDQAADSLSRAVRLRPDFSEAWCELGEARRKLERPDALAAFEKAVQTDPENAIARRRLGLELFRARRAADATPHLRAALRLAPTDQSAANTLLLALRQQGLSEEAAQVKERLVEMLRRIDRDSQREFNALRLNNDAVALEKQGNLAQAAEKYQQALDLDPTHNGIRVNLAVALLRLGRWQPGLDLLREALARDPNNAQIRAALADAERQQPPR